MLTQNNSLILQDFSNADQLNYRIINDGVMGGLSQSQLQLTKDGTAMFSGELSYDNNGGFASVRLLLNEPVRSDSNLAKAKKILVRIKGDGRVYSFRIRTNDRFDGVAYKLDFATVKGEWLEIELPINDFKPTFRGRILRNVESLQPVKMEQIGFLLKDGPAGYFEMEVSWVKILF